MHPISDKELDKLFQQKFEHAELAPSGDLWAKISQKLEQPQKRTKPFPVFWMAAASVVFVIGAALWLNSSNEVIKLQGTPEMTNNYQSQESIPPVSDIQVSDGGLQDKRMARVIKSAAVSEEVDEEPQVRVSFASSAAEGNSETSLMASNTRSPKENTAKKEEEEMFIPDLYAGDLSRLDVTQNNMIARVDDERYMTAEEGSEVSGRRKRSIGSLVNYVVAKVDKRDNKIIEFKDGDEGSEVSGINLGPIKFKSKK